VADELSDWDEQNRLIQTVLSGIRRGLEDNVGARLPAEPAVRSTLHQIEKIRSSLSTGLRHPGWVRLLVEVRSEIEALVGTEAFTKFATKAPFRPTHSRSTRRQLFEINPEFGQAISALEAAHLLINVVSLLIRHSRSSEPSDVAELRRIIPPQKVAPIQFEIRDGRLALERKISATEAPDRASAEIARQELLRSGQRILTELRNSNCDRRLIESLEYLQDQLSTGESIIRVGLSNIGCEKLCDVYEAERPEAVAMIRSHTHGVNLFAAQFPEWHRFIENAAAVQINDNDVATIHATTKALVQRLDAETDLVDPEVPKTLSRLNNLISNPRTASKRAAFAILRSIENLASKVFSCGADLIEKTVTKTIDGLSTAASKALVVGLLTIALAGASSIGPVASKVKEMAWLRSAVELVQRQIERMLKE